MTLIDIQVNVFKYRKAKMTFLQKLKNLKKKDSFTINMFLKHMILICFALLKHASKKQHISLCGIINKV